jgi:hypothetical protein
MRTAPAAQPAEPPQEPPRALARAPACLAASPPAREAQGAVALSHAAVQIFRVSRSYSPGWMSCSQ